MAFWFHKIRHSEVVIYCGWCAGCCCWRYCYVVASVIALLAAVVADIDAIFTDTVAAVDATVTVVDIVVGLCCWTGYSCCRCC